MIEQREIAAALRYRAKNKRLAGRDRREAALMLALHVHVRDLDELGLDCGEYGNLVGLWGKAPDEFLTVRNTASVRTRVARRRFPIADDTWRAITMAHGGACLYCGLVKRLQIDHILPLAKGGTGAVTNLAPACGPCNLNKHAQFLGDWLRIRPDLCASDITQRWESARRRGVLDLELRAT